MILPITLWRIRKPFYCALHNLVDKTLSKAESEVNSLVSTNYLLFIAGRPPWRPESYRLQFPEPCAKRDQTQKQRLKIDTILRLASLRLSTERSLIGYLAKGTCTLLRPKIKCTEINSMFV